ncbi:CheR family methyltransferase [Jannaschia sp. M317]|uniref:CheR family methyltransferase n=1 Tax=Jannaschia sp. M317 TaxID=2867011 RepID=UPI0021A82DC7|nr:CheR family methyltransferase [Jannaschia sp. M317]UWQ17126.1 PAS domain-containing protein [Jannaschia sp. M317]
MIDDTPAPGPKDEPTQNQQARDADSSPHNPEESPPEPPLIVGIASSAGGLEAVSLLVQNLPRDLGVSYVLAQHMSPTHKSMLASLLSNETTLPVVELSADTVPSPDTIYVTQPNSDVIIENGQICLRPQIGTAIKPKPSADRLFESMAREMGERCVGLVLSGTGSDGSYGVQAIREAGGITIAQDVGTAKYDGMPASSIETGCIDLQLSPQQIGQHLAKILSKPRDLSRFKDVEEDPSPLSDLMQILLARTGVDFRDYRENTVNRRIARRMTALAIDHYEDYVQHCRGSAEEVDALHKDLLISVTRFFRDRDQFEQLSRRLRRLNRDRADGQIRVWVAGCATGEEAYSLAILLIEALGGVDALHQSRVQIFATDIDAHALEIGRKGVYPQTALNDVPDEFIDRYFRLTDGKVEVIPALRQMVLFSHHNIFQDPPFINLDLVSLRNVLIYFKTPLQERVLTRLHYALNDGGALFLGTSEAIGAMHAYFDTTNDGDKIFSKRPMSRRRFDRIGIAPGTQVPNHQRAMTAPVRMGHAEEAKDTAMFDQLARVVAPNGFVVTRGNDIVRVFGDISIVTELSERSSLALNVSILRPGLREDASRLTPVVLRYKEARRGNWHQLDGSDFNEVMLEAYPIIDENGGEAHVLFALRTRAHSAPGPELDALSNAEGRAYIHEMEVEMASTRETLQQTVEELQTSNEELQSVNEELQSTNEELQATNEEMETSNEELQSTNEELITVNEELQINAAELQTVTSEMLAVLDAVPLPILVIDHALQIRRASARAVDYFGLDGLTAVGVHLSQCHLPEGIPPLTRIVSDVFRLRESRDIHADIRGLMRQIRVTPYARRDGEVQGVTLTVTEFDTRGLDTMAGLMDNVGGFSHWRYDVGTGTMFWSDEVYRIHGLEPADQPPALDKAIDFYLPESKTRILAAFTACMEDGVSYSEPADLRRADGEVIRVHADAVPVRSDNGQIVSVVGTFRAVDDQNGADAGTEPS